MQQQSQPAVQLAHAGSASTTGPLVVVTMLFFMWGLLTSLNDVLIPHLKALYELTYVQAMCVQFCFFGAYLMVSLPAGMLIKLIGYQRGAVVGLSIAATGCALFYPAATSGYSAFLLAFFVLAAGITILQVAANPYVTVLGDAATASSRLTLTQAFNALGTTIAPALGGLLILGTGNARTEEISQLPQAGHTSYNFAQASAVQGPYLYLAGSLMALAVLLAMAHLPKIQMQTTKSADGLSLFAHRNLVLGALGIFMYVGGEVSIGSFLINFLGDRNVAALTPAAAATYVSYYWGGAMLGRFIGFAVMRKVSPGKAVALNAACAIMLIGVAILSHGHVAMWSLLAVGLCNSIMFPTIFSIALHNLGNHTGKASGVLCMCIVGGAIIPFAQGFLADGIGIQASFLVPAACYAYVLFFGIRYADIYDRQR
jgi:FHS family L-fucose permease-like MFS transporter